MLLQTETVFTKHTFSCNPTNSDFPTFMMQSMELIKTITKICEGLLDILPFFKDIWHLLDTKNTISALIKHFIT